MAKIGSYVLNIRGDWLKECDAMKSLVKVMEIFVKEFIMISSMHHY